MSDNVLGGSFCKWKRLPDNSFEVHPAPGTVFGVFAASAYNEVCVVVPTGIPGRVVVKATKNGERIDVSFAASGNFIFSVRYRSRKMVFDFLEELLSEYDDCMPNQKSVQLSVLVDTTEICEEHWKLNVSTFFGTHGSPPLKSTEVQQRVGAAQAKASPKKATRKVQKKPAAPKKNLKK